MSETCEVRISSPLSAAELLALSGLSCEDGRLLALKALLCLWEYTVEASVWRLDFVWVRRKD
jgi:hypothetical protein